MIDFQFVNQQKISLIGSDAWIKKIITYESKKLGEITFIFCDDDYLLEKNIKFLSHNSLTDVITFDYCENNNINGDVFISIDRVKENANEFKETFLNELHRVMAHGLLHLLGYKDKNQKEADIMRSKENFYLSIK